MVGQSPEHQGTDSSGASRSLYTGIGLVEVPDPVTFWGVLLSCPGTPLRSRIERESGGGAHLLEHGDVDVAEHGPEEADHLASDGGGSDLIGLLDGEPVKEGEEAVLAFPGMANDVGILPLLATPERSSDGWPLSVGPGGLNEDVTHAGVAGLGDGAEPLTVSGGVLTGDEADVGHELARVLEAAQIAELGGEDHSGLGLEAAEAANAIDEGFVARREGESGDAVVELVSALELVLEQGEVFGEDDVILDGECAGGEDLTDPGEVAHGPVLALAEDEPAPAHELEDVVAGLDDLALEALAAADEVTDPLVGFGGDVDEHEALVAEVAGQLDGVTPVGLAMLAGPPRDQRGRGEMAFDAPLGEGALQDVAGTGGLIAGAHRALGLQALEVATQLTQVVAQAVDAHGLGIAVAEDGGGDGVLVDVQADPEVDGRWHGAGLLSVLRTRGPHVALVLPLTSDANPRFAGGQPFHRVYDARQTQPHPQERVQQEREGVRLRSAPLSEPPRTVAFDRVGRVDRRRRF